MPAVSVIIGTYNHLSYLKLCLFSLERQTFRDFEVIIADDGSKPEIENWLNTYHPFFNITHLWQEDKGFRKCKILNKAILNANSDYLVFIDADCIQSKFFLMEHWQHRQEITYLGARRVMIDKNFSGQITKDLIHKGYFDRFTLWGLYHTMFGHISNFDETLRFLYFYKKNKPFSLLGCNFSIHKSDVLSINGFDEDYESRGGGEDTDIALRLKTTGHSMKSVRYLALQFHLGHDSYESKTRSEQLFLRKKEALNNNKCAVTIKSLLVDHKK